MKFTGVHFLGLLYFLLVSFLTMILYHIKDQTNWVSSPMRPIFVYFLIGVSIVYVFIMFVRYMKQKNYTSLIFLFLGLVPLVISVPYFQNPVVKESNE